jgi:(S)-2-hydroxyglutarate dehydrogenase
MDKVKIGIIGGGIVGLSVAYKISQTHPEAHIVLFEKEPHVAEHQTGRNSGVIHSGIYYKPGSIKAKTCRDGKAQLEAYCEENKIAFDRCGKVIIALNESELPALDRIFERGQANGVQSEVISVERLKELEPAVNGIKALHVPETGIVDYVGFCKSLAEKLTLLGHEIHLSSGVTQIIKTTDGITIGTPSGGEHVDFMVNCAGLHSDRIARLAGMKPKVKIVPFRGEYFELREQAHHLCRNLIYPVPDPNFPFLGVHFTRMIAGGVECGPNAVLAFAREGYTNTTINIGDLAETLTYGGFLKMASKYWRMGMGEMHRSFSKKAFVEALQHLIPAVTIDDLVSAPAGVRAQAVGADGALVDDFSFEEDECAVHVLNAPSPAATACLAIADHIVSLLSVKINRT